MHVSANNSIEEDSRFSELLRRSGATLRPSVYNVEASKDDGTFAVCNCLSHAIVEFDGTPLEDKQINRLAEMGFLSESPEIERAALKTSIDFVRFDKSSARLVICPTLACNFRCPYCFQDHHYAEDMTQQIQDATVRHAQDLLEEGIREIDVTWFGGEPLLRADIMFSLTSRLKSLCERYGAAHKSAIITNGYLLTPEVVEQMLLADPEGWSVQVTIDGSPKSHDAKRILASGQGTYERIVENISRASSSDIKIAVRVNVDKSNIREFPSVEQAFLGQSNVRCYITPITIEETQDDEQVRSCFSHAEHRAMWLEMAKDGSVALDARSLLDLRVTACTAEHFYSTVIDSEGYLYKCVDEVGRTDHAYGHLTKNLSNPSWRVRYTGRDIFNEAECSACSYFPVCQAGCYTQYMHNGFHNCSKVKALLPESLRLL